MKKIRIIADKVTFDTGEIIFYTPVQKRSPVLLKFRIALFETHFCLY